MASRAPSASSPKREPIEVTKHAWHGGSYPRTIEITGGSLTTRNPDGGALTNTWRVSDIVDVTQEARGMRLLELVTNVGIAAFPPLHTSSSSSPGTSVSTAAR